MGNNNITYRKISKNFSPIKLKGLIDQILPGKTLKQCQNIIKNSFIIGAFDNNKLVGIGRSLDDTVYSFITDVIVLPNYRGKGIGTMIVKELCEHLTKKGVKVIHCSTSKNLIEFYKKAGFSYEADDVALYFRKH